MCLLPAALLLITLTGGPSELSAREREATISQPVVVEWDPVAGFTEFLVQIRDNQTGKLSQLRVTGTKIELRLPRGSHSVRAAGINKFGKSGPWSKWRLVKRTWPEKIHEEAEERSEVPTGSGETEMKTEKGKVSAAPLFSLPDLWFLLPGASQIRRGEPYRGSTLIFTFLGLGGAFYGQWQGGNTLAADPANNALLLTIFLTANESPLLTALILENGRRAGEEAYQKKERNQRAIAGAAVALYAFHLFDALNWGKKDDAAGGLDLSLGWRRKVREIGERPNIRTEPTAEVRYTFFF